MNGDVRGAVLVIVSLALVALLGVMVLTVDVGQLLYKRRAMVNASDAAALAAALSCAGLADSDVPESMADIFATDNVGAATGGITNVFGCDGPAFGSVTVEYTMQQGLVFAGALGFDGPAAVRTEATAGWGPAGAASPLPIVVYTGGSQCIREGMEAGVSCSLWFDNDVGASSFGFLNLGQGWNVSAGDSCPSVGASLRQDWINGNWTGGPLAVNFPEPTFVCRVSGLTSSDWRTLTNRVGDDLIFPVSDTVTPDKYNVVGFMVLRLEAVLNSKSQWAGACGVPPNNSSAVCLKVSTVETQFGGSAAGQGADYGLRAIRLCDLEIGSCPE